MFVGFVELEDTLVVPYLALDAGLSPVNLDGLPVFRVYGPLGLLPLATGSSVFLDHGVVTNATHAAPVVITSADHGLTTGTAVTVSGVAGNTAANLTTTVVVLDADRFELDGSAGNGDYASGGTWNVTGLYRLSVACTAAAGFEAGTTCMILVQGSLAGVPTAGEIVFIVA